MNRAHSPDVVASNAATRDAALNRIMASAWVAPVIATTAIVKTLAPGPPVPVDRSWTRNQVLFAALK